MVPGSSAPQVVAIDTENAASNDSMLGINVAMGFEPLVERSAWQADIATLGSRLDS